MNTLVIAADMDYLADLERAAITAFNTLLPHGYNSTSGGDGVTKMSAEAIGRLKASLRVAWQDPESRQRRLDISRSPQARLAQSKRMTQRLASPEAKKQVGERSRIANNRPHTKEKISRIATEMHQKPEFKSRHRAAMKEVMNDPDRRRRISEKIREMWADPEFRAKRVSAIRRGRCVKKDDPTQ